MVVLVGKVLLIANPMEATVMRTATVLSLEDIVIAVYSALDDALHYAEISCTNGKLIPRPGPAPEVDDREILCLAILQELFSFESDHFFYQWLNANPTMIQLFPRRLSRPNWADRRALLALLIQRLSQAFIEMDDEENPPFSSWTLTPLTSADLSGQVERNGLAGLLKKVTAPL